jgi:hypothetical protein
VIVLIQIVAFDIFVLRMFKFSDCFFDVCDVIDPFDRLWLFYVDR